MITQITNCLVEKTVGGTGVCRVGRSLLPCVLNFVSAINNYHPQCRRFIIISLFMPVYISSSNHYLPMAFVTLPYCPAERIFHTHTHTHIGSQVCVDIQTGNDTHTHARTHACTHACTHAHKQLKKAHDSSEAHKDSSCVVFAIRGCSDDILFH